MSRRWRIAAFVSGIAVVFVALAAAPLSTRQGINYQVAVRSIPAYAKTLGFLYRHFEYQRLAGEITRGKRSPQERVLAVFDWTTQNIHSVPEGFPVVDDHVLHIIIRGYGTDDQKADVFTTLSTYAGVPAFWQWTKQPSGAVLVVSFARIGQEWVVFDVAKGIAFRSSTMIPSQIPNPLRAELHMPWQRFIVIVSHLFRKGEH